MRVKNVIQEDFNNYKLPCMFIGTISCGGKCCLEQHLPLSICQNDELRNAPVIDVSNEKIIAKYLDNSITSAICFGGLEPCEQWEELKDFIVQFRRVSLDDIVIYTGYYPQEIQDKIEWLKQYPNIVIKFGRFQPNQKPHYDEVLGVSLISTNQFAERIS